MRRVEVERRDRRMEREGLGSAPNLNDVIQTLPWQPEECLFKPLRLTKCRRRGRSLSTAPWRITNQPWTYCCVHSNIKTAKSKINVSSNFRGASLSHANPKTFIVLSGLLKLLMKLTVEGFYHPGEMPVWLFDWSESPVRKGRGR